MGHTLFDKIGVRVTALIAERTRMDVIANNIANINTTKTPGGGPYKRQSVVFSTILEDMIGEGSGKGVKVEKIVTDKSDPIKIYDPNHPHANKDGYVSYPNIDITKEMVDMVTATKSYEANLGVIRARKSMNNEVLSTLTV